MFLPNAAGEETKLKDYVLSWTATQFNITIPKPSLIIRCQNDYSVPDISKPLPQT